MLSLPSSPSDRLTAACARGDLPSAIAAVADGASVNEAGYARGWIIGQWRPLTAAVSNKHFDVVAWLLSHGADPNGDAVMYHGVRWSSAEVLQLLMDAGGDVTHTSHVKPLLFTVVRLATADKLAVLLERPSLDLTVTYKDKTPEQYARYRNKRAVADRIASEVSGVAVVVWPFRTW